MKGFSLVELLVVITIICALTFLTMFYGNRIKNRILHGQEAQFQQIERTLNDCYRRRCW